MRKSICSIIIIALIFCLSHCTYVTGEESENADNPEEISVTINENSSVLENEAVTDALQQKIKNILTHSVIFLYDWDKVWINGEEYSLEIPTFLENGVLFIPVPTVAVLLGASFVQSEDVYYLNRGGNVTAMMEDYNVVLVNSTSFVMKTTPIIRDGVFCLPANGLAKALSMRISKYPDGGICVFENESERLTNEVLCSLLDTLGVAVETNEENPKLQQLAMQCGEEYSKLERMAVEEKLWISDDQGTPSSITIGDDGNLIKQEYIINTPFPANSVFVEKEKSQEVMLCDIKTGKQIAEPADMLYIKELKAATGRYMELKAACDILNDEKARELRNVYLKAIRESLGEEAYRLDLADPYDTGLYSKENQENGWESLFAQAVVGDFLVFSASSTGPEYGYFNHSALILEKDEETGVLHLLHARGDEYGVGADLDMDYLSKNYFEEVDFYSSYGTIFLCRAGNLTPAEADIMVKDAYETYNGYQFGYGGRMGLEEINCTELIDESYHKAGIDIIEGDYDSRLKEVLKGNTKNLVLIPDDLLFSDKTKVIAVWRR